MTEQSLALTALLDSARRRHFAQLVLEQAGIASGAAFAGAILLLLVGTQILDWYWLVALFAASFGFGVWRTLQRIPSRYGLAQIIDARLNLHDTLSTAFVYAAGKRKADPELIAYQHEQAERLARKADAAAVFPMHMPKALYAVGGIALVAFGMFAIRYGVTHSLDLRPNLVKMAFDTVWKTDPKVPEEKKSALQKKVEEQLKKMGINVGSPDAEGTELDAAPESALNTVDTPDVNQAAATEGAQAKAMTTSEPNEAGDGEGSETADTASGSEDQSGEQPTDTAQGQAQDGKQDAAQKNASNQANNDKSSLMDRMRDAMASMLNKLKMQPKGGESRQQTAKNSQSGSKQQSQKGSKSQGKPDSEGAQTPDQQGQQGEGDQAQSAQGRSGERGAEKASNDSKSGVGKDDGDKSAKEAEQLAAMGKISEILGKRAQNVTGELMVEVAGGNQQLKTAYSGKVGQHAEAGGEITRDEVPLMYRDFVQQYFEHVRRAPATAAAKPKPAADATTPARRPSRVVE